MGQTVYEKWKHLLSFCSVSALFGRFFEIKACIILSFIHSYNTQNQMKANYTERVICTLKTMMYWYFTHIQTYKYEDVLQDLVSNYNNSPHSSLLGRTPASISQHEPMLWKKMYVDSLKPKPIIKKLRKSVLKSIDQLVGIVNNNIRA